MTFLVLLTASLIIARICLRSRDDALRAYVRTGCGIYPWIRLPFQALCIWRVPASAEVRPGDLARILVKRPSLAVLAALALVGCSSTSASLSDASTTADSGNRVVVVMEDASFKTEEITLPEGKGTTIEIVNNDSMPHDFAIEFLDLNAGTVEPRETVFTTVVAAKGTSEFVCTLHPGMKGRIRVV
jgi:plastocyanin